MHEKKDTLGVGVACIGVEREKRVNNTNCSRVLRKINETGLIFPNNLNTESDVINSKRWSTNLGLCQYMFLSAVSEVF